MEWLSAIAACASALAAMLAWAAKLWWSKEFASAKNEIIRAKDTQIALLEREIAGLKDLTPMKIREYFTSVCEQLEEYNDTLKCDLEKAHTEIAVQNKKLRELQARSGDQVSQIQHLENERDNLEKATKRFEAAMESYQKRLKGKQDQHQEMLFLIEPKIFNDIDNSWQNLRNYLAHNQDEIEHATELFYDKNWKNQMIRLGKELPLICKYECRFCPYSLNTKDTDNPEGTTKSKGSNG